MADERTPLVRVRGVAKDYHGLRPLRLQDLDLHPGQSLALLGFDAAMAEALVNLLTGATLPDTGQVLVFGEPTSSVRDHAAWMRLLDHFGLVSERGVLLDQLTAEQNLAMPLSLTVESMPDDLRQDARRLADEVGISGAELREPAGRLPAAARVRVRLGRALALNPDVLLAEHPNATLTPAESLAFAADFLRVAGARGAASLVMTADPRFADRIADRVLRLEPATGNLKRLGLWERLRLGS